MSGAGSRSRSKGPPGAERIIKKDNVNTAQIVRVADANLRTRKGVKGFSSLGDEDRAGSRDEGGIPEFPVRPNESWSWTIVEVQVLFPKGSAPHFSNVCCVL